MTSPLLAVQNLSAHYGPVAALDRIDLSVFAGQIVVLLGANGAGKTSLLRSISGVVKTSTGSVTFDGKTITGCAPASIAAMGIGHVPEGREIFSQLTVLENLRMGTYLRRDRAQVVDDLDEIFVLFPALRERSGILAGFLSGGQQQMLAVGRALLTRPKLLLLDEPSLGLAPLLTRDLLTSIASLNARRGLSILLVEQNVGLALKLGHFVYVMANGRIVASGAPDKFSSQTDIAGHYFGSSRETVYSSQDE